MTVEEAIEVLKKNRPGADPRRCGLELCTAVDVTIAALREQCVRDATKTSGDAVTDSHQLETVTNRNGLNCIGIEAINRLESDTVKVVDSDQFKTNADHIRSMTDEELAKRNVQDSLEYTVDYDWDERPIGEYTPCFKTSDGAIFWSYEDAVDYELHWLKQPYKEEA